MLRQRKDLRVPGDPSSHPVWRSPEAALKATQRLVRIAQETGARIHILHISTAEEMVFLAEHKDVASVEVTPHHLTLDGTEAYARLGTLVQMNPPVRDAAHRDGIWHGLTQGVADILGSDHAPHLMEEKAKPYPDSPSGMGADAALAAAAREIGVGLLDRHVAHGSARADLPAQALPMQDEGGLRVLRQFLALGRIDIGVEDEAALVGAFEQNHGGQEIAYVLAGEVELVVADRSVVLGVGDCAAYDGGLPHRLRRLGGGPASVLVIITG